MEVKVQAHVAYQTRYHVVWIPKYRKKVLIEGVKEYLEKTVQTSIQDRHPDVYVIELTVQEDHAHALRVCRIFMSRWVLCEYGWVQRRDSKEVHTLPRTASVWSSYACSSKTLRALACGEIIYENCNLS